MIYTSYFARMNILQERGICCVSVANSAPQGVTIPRIHEVVPPWELVDAWRRGEISWDGYTERYCAQLAKLDKESILNKIRRLGKNVALLCWENNDKPCHRHILAEWLGCDVQEFVP